MLDVPLLSGSPRPVRRRPAPLRIVVADPAQRAEYRRIRREVFVREQGIFTADDRDRVDEDPRTVVLVALDPAGEVLGGVRVAPVPEGRDIGWWSGSRLAVRRGARRAGGIGSALVREACSTIAGLGVLRFDATVQLGAAVLFDHLGWQRVGTTTVQGVPHLLMQWPIDRVQRLVTGTKSALGSVLEPFGRALPSGAAGDPEAAGRPRPLLGGEGFVGDDASPVPGSDLVAACDAILPAMVDRDPEWAGWCGVLVNVHDVAAMGAEPVGLLDAIGARTVREARRVAEGIAEASRAWAVPVLGGHTQFGVDPSLSVTAIGRTARPVPGGGGRPGHDLHLTADLHGAWRPGYEGRQWDSSSTRTPEALQDLAGTVRRARPAAAKDVSMGGIIGTAGMLAEASGTGAVLDVAAVPAPGAAAHGDWLTCFPGFGMLTADPRGASRMGSRFAPTARIGTLDDRPGVRLRWPDGVETTALDAAVTGLGTA